MLSTVLRHTPKSVDLDLDSTMRGRKVTWTCVGILCGIQGICVFEKYGCVLILSVISFSFYIIIRSPYPTRPPAQLQKFTPVP